MSDKSTHRVAKNKMNVNCLTSAVFQIRGFAFGLVGGIADGALTDRFGLRGYRTCDLLIFVLL